MKTTKYFADLEILKKLNVKYKKAGKDFQEKMTNEHGISRATIYRDISKRNARVRKVRNDRGKEKRKVTIEEKEIISQAVSAGKTKKEAATIAAEVTGRKKIGVNKLVSVKPDPDSVPENLFGGAVKQLIEKIFKLDLMAEHQSVRVKVGNLQISLSKDDVEDIAMVLANAYNRNEFATEKKLKFDRTMLRKAMLSNLIEEQVNIAKDAGDYKMLEAITRMQERMDTDKEMSGDFAVFDKCMRELNPELTKEEIINLIKKNS
jgi:hypothetical protein